MATEKVLVLGHGRSTDMRCANKFAPAFDLQTATCVDILPNLNPDVVVDLTQGNWPFDTSTFDMPQVARECPCDCPRWRHFLAD